jgi:hypothetical protein
MEENKPDTRVETARCSKHTKAVVTFLLMAVLLIAVAAGYVVFLKADSNSSGFNVSGLFDSLFSRDQSVSTETVSLEGSESETTGADAGAAALAQVRALQAATTADATPRGEESVVDEPVTEPATSAAFEQVRDLRGIGD